MDAHLADADQSFLGSNWTAGDIMYADLNNDGKVDRGEYTLDNHGDLKVIGSATFWGATGTGKWQALGFKEHEDYWTPEHTNAYYPRPDWGASRNTNTQTRYLQNAAYCRLKNVTLGYTLPKNLTEKFFVENLRVFASAENLLTITSFTGIADPELIGAGYGENLGKTYPLSKTVSLGLSVTF